MPGILRSLVNGESRKEGEVLERQKCSRISSREGNLRIGGFSRGGARGKGTRRFGGVVLGRRDSLLTVSVWKELISEVCFRAQFIFHPLKPTGLESSKFP